MWTGAEKRFLDLAQSLGWTSQWNFKNLERLKASHGQAKIWGLLFQRGKLDRSRIQYLLQAIRKGGLACSKCAKIFPRPQEKSTDLLCPHCQSRLQDFPPLHSKDSSPVETSPASSEALTVEERDPAVDVTGPTLEERPENMEIDGPTVDEPSPLANHGAPTDAEQEVVTPPSPGEEATVDISSENTPARSSPKEEKEISKFQNTYYPKTPRKMKVKKVFGKGGYGIVYQVQDPFTGRTMALKQISKEKANIERKKRFSREIEITSRLQHPHIIPVYISGRTEEGSPFYAMKELEGGDLAELVGPMGRQRKTPLRELLDIFHKVLEAVEYAHSEGVIHRDLKADNIAVGDFGEVYVIDWGIAKIKGEKEKDSAPSKGKNAPDKNPASSQKPSSPDLTRADGMMGTPGYMSPEQLKNRDVDERSDVFCLGAILYQILTTEVPFPGDTPHERMAKTLHDEEVERAHHRRPDLDISEELSSIASRALAKDKENRYQSAEEMRGDLERYFQGQPVSAHEYSSWEIFKKIWAQNKVPLAACGTSFVIIVLLLSFFILGEKWKASHQVTQTLAEVKNFQSQARESQKAFEKGKEKRDLEKAIQSYTRCREELEGLLQVAPDNGKVREKLFEIERDLGLVAMKGKNYLLSRLSFERCRALVGGEKTESLFQKLKEKKRAVKRRDLKKIDAIMNALKGKAPPAGMVEEYVTQIVKIKADHTVEKLISLVNSPHQWQRQVAIEALGKLKNTTATWKGQDSVEVLMERLKNLSIENYRQEAREIIWALGRLRDSRAYTLVGRLRWRNRNLGPFMSQTEIPFRWIPIPDEFPDSDSPREWFIRGIIKYYRGDLELAKGDLKKALSLHPGYGRAHNGLGLIFEKEKKYSQAKKHYQKAVEGEKPFWMGYNNLGDLFLQKGKYSQALQCYNRALEKRKFLENYQKAAVYASRGRVYSEERKYQLALADCNKALKLNPHSGNILNERGKALANMGQFRKAIDDYTRAISLGYDWGQIYFNRGVAFRKLRMWNRALADFNKALEKNFNFWPAFPGRASVFVELGRFDKGLEVINEGIELHPQEGKLYGFRGVIYLKTSNFSRAISDFTKAYRLDKSDMQSLYKRAHGYLKTQQYERALADLENLEKGNYPPHLTSAFRAEIYWKQGRKKKALGYISKRIEKEDSHPKLKYHRAVFYLLDGQSERALRDLEAFLQARPRHLQGRIYLGKIYGEKKMWSQGLKHLNIAVRLQPERSKTYLVRANIRLKKGDFQGALADYNQMISTTSRKNLLSMAYANRGLIFFKYLKKYPQAISAYSQAISLQPREASNYYNRGTVYKKMRRYDKALADFNQVIEINPQHKRAFLNRGNCHLDLGKAREAVKNYTRALEIDPNFYNGYRNRGNAWYLLKKYDRALANYRRAASIKTLDKEIIFRKGNIYLYTNQYRKSIQSFTQFIQRDPDFANAYFNRALVWDKMGETKKAVSDFKKALKYKVKASKLVRYARQYIEKHSPK